MQSHMIKRILSVMLLMGVSLACSVSAADGLTGTLAVVNKSDNSISVIDVSTKSIVATLPTGEGPHELVLSGDNKWAVSTDFVGGNSLTVFDLSAQEVVHTIDLPTLPGPHGIRFMQDNEHVIFTSGRAQKLGIVNIVSKEVLNDFATAQETTHMVSLNEDESIAYSTNIRSDSISVIDLKQARKIKDIATEAMPEAINYRVSAQELWYGANEDGKLVVIDPVTEAVLASWDGFKFPYRVLFNQDESIAMVPDFQNHYVRFFDTNTKQELGTLALEKEAGPQGIVLHSSDDIAFLSLNLKNKIVAIDIATRTVVDEYPTGNNPDGVVFMPSSSRQ